MATGLRDDDWAHPLETLVAGLRTQLDAHVDAPAWTLTPHQLTALLPQLAVARNQLDALELRLLREADRLAVGDAVGAASTAGWWANVTRSAKPSAHRAVALAARLDDDGHAATHAATAEGRVSRDQAAVIVDAVDALPSDLVDPALRRDVEDHLVGLAAHHAPKELRILGRRVLEVLAPDVAEEHERRILEAEEQRAAASASFTMNPDGLGSMVGRFKIPVLAGEILAKHLAALAAPRHRHATTGPEPTGARVARPLRLGTAFAEYVESKGPTPRAGGAAATVVVTIPLADLLGADGAATLDSGSRISASEARRLACRAGLIPAVLGSKSQVLDLGRKTRFHTGPQRIALALRDGGCAERHCDWPPGMCHAHHRTPWSRGGSTSVADGVLLCPRHHALAHDARYQMKSDPSGRVSFTRRT